MRQRQASPQRVKIHRSYTTGELADLLGVHKNTIRHWQTRGLAPIDRSRPALFQGREVRDFLTRQRAGRKRPCGPGHLYCFRCRQARKPALGMVDFLTTSALTGNLRGLCAVCEAVMHRKARLADLPRIMPGFAIQMVDG
jgi:hypothetical protein